MRRLPSLRGLQAFEAVARTGNLSSAADQLAITPSAVSHRIRGLEQELCIELLRRTSTGLRLTETGRRYRGDVEEAFALLARATADIVGPDLSRPLTVSLTTEFGVHWLMPRFHRFRDLHPEIDIAILATHAVADLAAGEADLALRHGAGDWPDVKSEPVLRFHVSPLCTPTLKKGMAGLAPAEALAQNIVIRADYDDWEPWLEAAGIDELKPARQLWFGNYSMAIKAAVSGQGIILGYSSYTDAEIAEGKLAKPFDLTVPIVSGYHLVYLEERLADPRVGAFRDWVIAESGQAEGTG
jgi:LysR family transcriptional regulator, glycine cleavage system transcriptional activator